MTLKKYLEGKKVGELKQIVRDVKFLVKGSIKITQKKAGLVDDLAKIMQYKDVDKKDLMIKESAYRTDRKRPEEGKYTPRLTPTTPKPTPKPKE